MHKYIKAIELNILQCLRCKRGASFELETELFDSEYTKLYDTRRCSSALSYCEEGENVEKVDVILKIPSVNTAAVFSSIGSTKINIKWI